MVGRVMETVALRVPTAMADRWRDSAAECELSLSEWIRRACEGSQSVVVRPVRDVGPMLELFLEGLGEVELPVYAQPK